MAFVPERDEPTPRTMTVSPGGSVTLGALIISQAEWGPVTARTERKDGWWPFPFVTLANTL